MKKSNMIDTNNRLGRAHLAPLLLAACLSLGGAAMGQGFLFTQTLPYTNRIGTKSVSYGSDWAGLSGGYNVTATRTLDSVASKLSRVSLSGYSTVKFLQASVAGVRYSASVENNNGTKRASRSMSVSGYLVDSGSTSASCRWFLPPIPVPVFDMEAGVTVGGIPLTIGGCLMSIGGVDYGPEFDLENAHYISPVLGGVVG